MMEKIEKKIIPAYPFVQYNDDENVVAFFTAYNHLAQDYLTALNRLHLPCWTSPSVSGWLLDWVAWGIYRQVRPAVSIVNGKSFKGEYNTVEYNGALYGLPTSTPQGQFRYLSDDVFRRVLTWNFYKGDGFQFSIPWMKRRISRFIHGANGRDQGVSHTFDVSIQSHDRQFTIILPDDREEGVVRYLVALMASGAVKLPFSYTYETKIKGES